MTENKDYTFFVSISKDAYTTKTMALVATAKDTPQNREKRKELGLEYKMGFKQVEVNPQQLLTYALNGHSFCSLFGDFDTVDKYDHPILRNDGYFTMSGKSCQYFKGSYFIGIDIDNTHLTTTEFIDRLTLKPTFWYTSLSHLQKDKNNDGILDSRFRLVYVLDSKIEGELYFRYCAYCLSQIIRYDTQEQECIDESAYSCSQYFNGTNIKSDTLTVEYGLSNFIYSVSDFNVSDSGFIDFLNQNCLYKSRGTISKKLPLIKLALSNFSGRPVLSDSDIISQSSPTHLISESDKTGRSAFESEFDLEIDTTMILDYKRLSWEEFHKNYKQQYSLVYRTESPDWDVIHLKDQCIRYQICDADYLGLSWIVSKNGGRRKNGTQRRNTLFHRCWLRRIIKPDITPNEVLYNLIWDMGHFFDNSDGVLDEEFMLNKVRQCFEYTPEELIEKYRNVYDDAVEESKRKKFIIHWMDRKKIRPNSVSREIRWMLLDKIYDQRLTVDENLQIFKDSDIDQLNIGLSRTTLYEYCKVRGYDKGVNLKSRKDRFRMLHLDGMSLMEEKRYLEECGLKLSKTTISKYRMELESGR